MNIEDSGEIGEMLLKTYRSLFIKLNVAYIENNIEKISEVRDSLKGLEESWQKVFRSPEYQEFKKNRVGSIKTYSSK